MSKRKMCAIKELKYIEMDKKSDYKIWYSKDVNIKIEDMTDDFIKNLIFDLSEFSIKYSIPNYKFDNKYIKKWIKSLEKELSKRYFWLENT